MTFRGVATFDLKPDDALPELAGLLPAGGGIDSERYEIEDTYFDTEAGDLRRLGLTLRQRHGGPDAGWQLKIPTGRAPTGISSKSRSGTVPRAIAEPLFGVRRGQDLGAVATLSTIRHLTRLRNADGDVLAEIVDDSVSSASMGDNTTLRKWREVGVSSTGDEQLLKAVRKLLVKSGAKSSRSAPQLKRALGPAVSASDVDRSSLGGVIARYVSAQCDEFVYGDLGMRLDQPVVHATRVAVRRLRSTLRIFRPVFEREAAAELEADLVWFAGLLGEVRDRDILRNRYQTQVAALPSEFVLGPVASHIETILLAERSHHLRQVNEAMNSERYRHLLGTLSLWRTVPPFTAAAGSPGGKVSTYVAAAERKLHRRLGAAGGDVEALHRARKAGKRFRYASELSVPVVGKKASKTVKTAKKLQTLLGEHQDSVVSAQFLRKLGASAGVKQELNGFTYGILLAEEWRRGEGIRKELDKQYG